MIIKDYNIKDLIFSEYNPRKISNKQLKDLESSIKRFGVVEPVVVNINKSRKNIIISGGMNIYPEEIENILLKHPTVDDAVVKGKEDAVMGEIVVADLKLKDGMTKDLEQIKRHVKIHLAQQKWPRIYNFVDEIKRTATGKVLRR